MYKQSLGNNENLSESMRKSLKSVRLYGHHEKIIKSFYILYKINENQYKTIRKSWKSLRSYRKSLENHENLS